MAEADKILAEHWLYGYKMVACDEIFSKLVRVKTHKKKRIDKKWCKRYGYERVPDNKVCVTADGYLYAHSKYIEALIEEGKRREMV